MNYFDVLFAKKQSGGGGTPTLITKTITENGTYNASSDNADGYSSVTVAVEGFKKKSIANTPTDIVSFNDGTANPMPSLEISIEPQQDLHGYDNPWVGGAGKNKINVPDGKITSAGFIFNFTDLNLPAGTYTLSAQSNPALQQSITSFAVVTGSTTPINRSITTPYTFTVENNITGMRLYVTTSCEYYNIQLEIGSLATSYAPYENICPISGHTEANVTVTDDLTTPTETHITSIPFHDSSDNSITVYGGRLDVTSGELTVDRAYVDLSTLSWVYNSFGTGSSWKTPVLTNMKSYADGEMPNILCEKYKPNTINKIYQDNVGIGIRQNGSTLYVNNQDSANSPTGQLVYELATPITYQLTPTQVSTLLGQNNIFADCGQILEGEYFVAL